MDFRWVAALWKSAAIVLRAWARVARKLFHELTGVLFAAFAVYGALAAWRQWNQTHLRWMVGLAAGYAVMMAAFAFIAFRTARRIR